MMFVKRTEYKKYIYKGCSVVILQVEVKMRNYILYGEKLFGDNKSCNRNYLIIDSFVSERHVGNEILCRI